MFLRTVLDRWFDATIPNDLPFTTLEEREYARKLHLNSKMILIALIIVSIYLGINFWPIDLGTICNVMYFGAIVVAGRLNKSGRLFIANNLMTFGALSILTFDMIVVIVRTPITLLWMWSIFTLLPPVAGVLLNKKLPMMIGVCNLIAVLLVVTSRFHAYSAYVHGYTLIMLVSYMIIVNIASAGLSAFYAQSVNEAIRQSDRAFELERLHDQLQQSFQHLDEISHTDHVTGLVVRRHFLEIIEQKFQQKDYPVSLIFTDIDHFKHVNDTWGHHAGDVALAHVAACFKQVISACGFPHITIARYGGEEFVMVASHMAHEDAQNLAEKLRQEIASTPCTFQTLSIPLTCSFGVATTSQYGDTPHRLIESADQAMYQAKHLGRNRVCSANEPFLQAA